MKIGNYSWYNFNNLEEAMSDTNITSTIFNNKESMKFLITKPQLISDIKSLDNYSNTLVSKILSSTVYTDSQKYQYNLPFYLYNQGSYDSSLFTINSTYYEGYRLGVTLTYQNNSTYVYYSSKQKPNGCATLDAYSNFELQLDNYVNLKMNVTSYNYASNYASGNMASFDGAASILFGDNTTRIKKGLISHDISNSVGKYKFLIRNRSCNNAYDSSGGYAYYTETFKYDKLWLE